MLVGAVYGLLTRQQKPKGAHVVQDIDLEKYSGKWYEIARFDFRHEKNIDNTTADYSLNEDGSIKVVNRGFDYAKDKWTEAVGKAFPAGLQNEGTLKVSFFGPFFSPYNIIDLDEDYQNALVVGKNKDYIWFLSRTPKMSQGTKDRFLEKAANLGYDLERLVWVQHGNR